MIVVKLGGSVITKKREGVPELREEVLRRLAEILSRFDVVIVHGAGSFVVPALRYRDNPREFLLRLRSAQLRLNHLVTEVLLDYMPVYYVDGNSLMEGGSLSPQRIKEWVSAVREGGLVPLSSATLSFDPERGPSIVSGDDVALAIGKAFRSRVLFLTGVPGVLDSSGRVLREVRGVEGIVDLGSKDFDPSGAMVSKVKKILQYGVKSFIASGFDVENVEAFLEGKEARGTWVIP